MTSPKIVNLLLRVKVVLLHLLPKIIMFCALSQNNEQLFEK